MIASESTTHSVESNEANMHPATAREPSGQMWQTDRAVHEIRSAFILGWSLVELRSRIQVAALDVNKLPSIATGRNGHVRPGTADPLQLVKGVNETVLRASRMRTTFNYIVTLQMEQFPSSVTVGSLYDPPSQSELPYLYPPEPDYANIGINPLGKDKSGRPLWADFRLFEVTRRAINCLTLLLVTPEDSLVPTLVSAHQTQLVKQILDAARSEYGNGEEQNTDAPSKVHSLAATVVKVCQSHESRRSMDTAPEAAGRAPMSEHGNAITTLSFLTVRLLQAWEGYLRERITAEGVGANNLITLLAYEAGCNLATISWSTSVNAILLESQAAQDEKAKVDLCKGLYQVWKDTFTDSNLLHVLHQITALSAALDDAYHRYNQKTPAPSGDSPMDELLVRPDPALPSQVLQTVRQSIEYWQRTVLWLGNTQNNDHLDVRDWQLLRSALIEQSGIWFNLMTGQQDLRGFTIESITHQVLAEPLRNFRELAQRDLPAAAQQAAKEVGEVVDTATRSVIEISATATRAAKAGLGEMLRAVNPVLWIVVGVSALTFLVLLGYILITGRMEAVTVMLSSIVTTALSYLGIKRGSDSKTSSEQSVTSAIETERTNKTREIQEIRGNRPAAPATGGLANTIGGALGQAGSFLIAAYEKGLLRIQIELQSLNYSVAVTHPLIEFFIRHDKYNSIQEDFDFLTRVIWDSASREAQLRRIVTAAFGPISILLISSSSNNAKPPAAER